MGFERLNFEKLTCADDVTRYPDVRLARRGVSAYAACGITGVISHLFLCRMVMLSPGLC